MLVDGRVIIGQVLEQIDAAEMCIFDLTKQSENVLFEIGYAIAKVSLYGLHLTRQLKALGQDGKS